MAAIKKFENIKARKSKAIFISPWTQNTSIIKNFINFDKLVKNRSDGIVKIRYTRRGVFLRERPYIWYAERIKNRRDAFFYDVVKFV